MRRLFVTLFTLGLLAAACGSDGPDVTTSADGDDPTSSDTPATTEDPDTVLPSDDDGSGDASGTRPVDGEDAYAVADLAVVITHPDADDISYTISCLGDTATIVGSVTGVSAETACVALKNADIVDRLIGGAPVNQICTEQYGGPEIATITGRLAGESVGTSIDRVNGCGIGDWDVLLAGILPTALGVTG